MLAAHAEAPDLLGDAVTALMEINPQPYFVQIGGFDGVSFDPLRRQIVNKNLSGLIVEPIPQYFDKLKALYAGSDNVRCVNCAITEEDGERTIWRFNPLAVERGLLPPHFAGISSFLMEDLLKDTGVLGRSSPNPETTAALRSLLQAVPVQCRTMESLLTEQGVKTVDILQIDTEGYDYIILTLFDFAKYTPGIVHYEHQHLSPADREAAEVLLRSHGYEIRRNVYDTLAVLESANAASRPHALRDLALSLDAEGRGKDALLLMEHLASIAPNDAEILRPLVRLLNAQGRTLDALEKLGELKACAIDMESVLGDIEHQMPPAIQGFNECLATGNIEKAEAYASALVALVPRNQALLNAALSCNLALGRKPMAAKYAATLLSLDSNHVAARATLEDAVKTAAPPADDIEDKVKLALVPQAETHPLLRLRDLHDAASAILCRPLNGRSTEQVEKLLAAARALDVKNHAGSEWEGWEKHYRTMLDGIDLSAVYGPTPDAAREPEIVLMNASGTKLNWLELRAAAARLGAETVFFAAADKAYIDLYARSYIDSILKHCDVPCLIVVHAIGGAAGLREIAKSVGVRDKRLFFTGDTFDPKSVATKCYDAPPKGQIAKPVAHLQSTRFLRLGSFLQKLKRPVFVSDIDLLLQRGVKDLLVRAKDADIVMNENGTNTHAGSRLTANLLLANPTDNAAIFVRFLRSYLERALDKREVTRWIDQLALLLARHHLVLKAENPRIEYFDTASDINNVMYTAYQENPFRFLSLYHGFDMSSLTGNATVQVQKPKKQKKAVRARKRSVKAAKRRSR